MMRAHNLSRLSALIVRNDKVLRYYIKLSNNGDPTMTKNEEDALVFEFESDMLEFRETYIDNHPRWKGIPVINQFFARSKEKNKRERRMIDEQTYTRVINKEMTRGELGSLQDFLKYLGWSIELTKNINLALTNNSTTIELQKYSPLGEDYSFYIEIEEKITLHQFLEEFKKASYMFDKDEHVINWIIHRSNSNRDHGIPLSVEALVNDAKAIERMHNDLVSYTEKYIEDEVQLYE